MNTINSFKKGDLIQNRFTEQCFIITTSIHRDLYAGKVMRWRNVINVSTTETRKMHAREFKFYILISSAHA